MPGDDNWMRARLSRQPFGQAMEPTRRDVRRPHAPYFRATVDCWHARGYQIPIATGGGLPR